MIKNNFIIALRKFRRNKFFSFINIAGLGVGISAALVIYLIVQHEFSYERFQKDGDRIYRVVSNLTFPGGVEFKNSGVPKPMPEAVRKELTGIETATHFVTSGEVKVTVPPDEHRLQQLFKKQNNITYADQFYFSVFDYKWSAGPGPGALKEPFRVVLTESRARDYFGNTSPANIIGKEIIYDDSIKCTVSGIVKDIESKATDLRFKEFISLATALHTRMKEEFGIEQWGSISSNSQLFLKLTKGTKPGQVAAQFPGLRKKYLKPAEGQKDDAVNQLQELKDIHFNQAYDAFDGRQAYKPTLYGLLAVAGFLLLLGCINFINLTTAQSGLRAKRDRHP